jgi:hypothetical protein
MKILCACLIAGVVAIRKPVDVLAEIESKLGELKEMLARPRPADMFDEPTAPPPPPLDGLSAESQPSYLPFPISADELSYGKGKLRRMDTSAPPPSPPLDAFPISAHELSYGKAKLKRTGKQEN